jgi:hypothetical protein
LPALQADLKGATLGRNSWPDQSRDHHEPGKFGKSGCLSSTTSGRAAGAPKNLEIIRSGVSRLAGMFHRNPGQVTQYEPIHFSKISPWNNFRCSTRESPVQRTPLGIFGVAYRRSSRLAWLRGKKLVARIQPRKERTNLTSRPYLCFRLAKACLMSSWSATDGSALNKSCN